MRNYIGMKEMRGLVKLANMIEAKVNEQFEIKYGRKPKAYFSYEYDAEQREIYEVIHTSYGTQRMKVSFTKLAILICDHSADLE